MFFCISVLSIKAQQFDIGRLYRFSQTTGVYTPLVGATVITNISAGADDATSAAITIPTMNFGVTAANGTTPAVVDRMYVNSNGWIGLSNVAVSPTTTGYSMLNTTSTNMAALAPLNDDMGTSGGDPTTEVSYLITGTDVYVQFKNMRAWASAAYLNFQVVIHTATGVIEYIYGDCTTTTVNELKQIGLRGSSTSFPANVLIRTTQVVTSPAAVNNYDSTVPGLAASTQSQFQTITTPVAADIKPTNGLTFVYTPVAIADACSMPASSSSTITVTNATATVAWTAASPAAASGYAVRWKKVGDPIANYQSATVPAGTLSYTITGLQGETAYHFEVQGLCSATVASEWGHSRTFVTGCSNAPNPGTHASATANVCPNATATLSVTGASTLNGVTYAWEESDDNGVTDPWGPAVSGTGATTTTYTSPGFIGVGNPPTIYYRMKATCSYSAAASYTSGVQLITLPPSLQASNITTTNISAVSATINFTAGDGTGRAVYISDANNFTAPVNGVALPAANAVWANAGQQLVASGAVTSVSVSGLAPGATYYVAVYEYKLCNGSNIYATAGGANNPNSFTTCTAIAALPWTEGFEAITIPAFPSCWFKQNGDWLTTNNANSTFDADARTGNNFLRNAWSATNEYMWTPGFDLTAGTSYDFSFYWAGDNFAGWTGDVFVNSTPSGTGATQLGTSFVTSAVTTTKNYAKSTNTFIPTTSGVYFFAIRVNEATGNPWYLSFDDFTLENTPSCFEATTLAVTSVSDVSANLGWAAPTGGSTPTGYNWVVVAAGAGSAGTPVASGVATTTSASATGLTDNTSYEFWVQTDCGSGALGAWAGPKTFRTECIAVTSFPFNEGFETTSPTLNCWTVVDGNGDGDKWVPTTTNPRTGTGCYTMYTDFNSVNQDYLISPKLSLGTVPRRLKFWTRAYSTAEPDEISVKVSTTGKNIVDFTATAMATTPVNYTTYKEYTVDLTPYTGDVYIAFVRENAPADGWYLYVDDVLIEDAPTCLEPTLVIATNVSKTGADISWTASTSNPANGYQYEVRTSGAPGSGATGLVTSGVTAAGVTTTTLTGLAADTDYFVYVLSDCGNGDLSGWSAAGTFYTGPCKPISTSGCTDGDVIGRVVLNTLDNNTGVNNCPAPAASTHFTVFPQSGSTTTTLNAGTSYNCTVWVGQYQEGVAVWIDFNNNLVFETSERIGASGIIPGSGAINTLGGSVTFPVSIPCNPTPGDYRMRVRCSYAAAGNTIDPCNLITYSETEDYYITIAPPPPCPAPSNLAATGITYSGASLSWTAGCTETEWDVHVTTLGGGAPTGAASNPGVTGTPALSVTGLMSLTAYEYWVRAVCTTGSVYSTWVGPFTFTTTDLYCTPAYTVGKTDGDLISEIIISGTTLNNNSGTAPVNPSFTLFTGQPNYTADLQAGASYTVSVTVGTFGSQNVAAWIDYNDNLTFEASEKIGFTTAAIGANGSATFIISLSCAPPVGLHRMRIRDVYSVAGNTIDPCTTYAYGETEDYIINVLPPPPCPAPRNLAATATGSGQATFTWAAGCTETEWDLHVTTLGGGAPTGVASNPAVSSTTVTASLPTTPALEYEFWVRANCGAGSSSTWTGPYVFMINDEACGAYTLTVGAPPVAQSTVNATSTANDPTNPCSANNNTVWFKFTPQSAGDYIITTSNPTTGTPLLYSWIFVFTTSSCSGGSSAFVPVTTGCITGCLGTPGSSVETTLTNLVAGQDYYIYVDGNSGSTGLFEIKVDRVSAYLNARTLLSHADPISGVMDNYVSTIANFPLSDPYAVSGAYGGAYTLVNHPTLSTSPAVLAVTGNDAIVDWVFLELRQGTSGTTTVAATRSALLQKDGDIVDTDGVSPVKFENATPGNYYVTVRHRNHLGYRTSLLYTLSGVSALTPVLNLSNNTIPLYGSNPNYSLTSSVYVMIGGDANSDGSVDALDSVDWEAQNGLFDDYTNNADYNSDGSVDALDSIIWEIHNGKFEELN